MNTKSTVLCSLLLAVAALPASADPSYPLICRGNSKASFTTGGPKASLSFQPDLAGPVTSAGLPVGSCGWADRAMRSDETGLFASYGQVQSLILGGQFAGFFPSQDDLYLKRFTDSNRYFIVYVSGAGNALKVTSSLGDAMDDAPRAFATNTGSTALPMLHNDHTPSCASSSAPDVYYHLQLVAPARIQANTFGSAFDTVLEVVDAGGTSHGCNDDASPTNRQSQLDVTLPAGDYYLVVDGYAYESGSFSLSMQLTWL